MSFDSNDLDRMVDHLEWANTVVLTHFLAHTPSADSLRLMRHILAAERIWLDRIESGTSDMEVWPDFPIRELPRLMQRNVGDLKVAVAELAETPGAVTRYHTTTGQEHQTLRREILIHVMLHGQHHRAQLAQLIRQAGGEPPVTDFIAFTRTH